MIKMTNLVFAAFAALLLFSSCQKNMDAGADGDSVGSLKSALTGECMPVTVNGIFKVDSVLNNDNYVDVQVNVTVAGTFEIKTDTINGYSFKKTGTVGTGLNTIRLYASGKPVATGVNTFTIHYGLTSCRFDITVFGAGMGTALYTLGGSPGNCSVSAITGNYVVGQAMTANNKVEMTVNVTTAGTYIITGTLINGVSFDASGVFTHAGIQNIFLSASGTPTAAGLFNYPVSNATTSCNVPITYTATVTNATYALSGSPGNCTAATINGTYAAGTPLTTANFAVINVNVTSPGNYAIATTTVNGISFSATGTFNITGPQQVSLAGTGTPLITGTFNFPLSGNGNTCNISVVCTAGVPGANIDYIPQSSFSNWTQKVVGGGPGDTAHFSVSPNPIVIGGNTYRIYETANLTPGMPPTDSMYHRKVGGLYYHLFKEDYYFDNNFSTDGLLLDSTVAAGATWTVNLGANTWGGLPATGKIAVKILAKGVTVTVAGNTYNNVIKAEYIFSHNTGAGDIDHYYVETWYGRGVGMLYNKIHKIPLAAQVEDQVIRYQVF